MQFKSTGWRHIDIDEFAMALDVRPSHRSNFAQLRRWIIEPAVKELVEKDGWSIAWVPIKAGRKVTALRFTFSRARQGRLEL
ncbi:replication initiation protein [Burkholderia pseudomallei]|uniref:replication initiation protein n=2 Tax=Burkholderia TaxID=32008 RepID=UPI001E2A81DC|nr:replication initiation protein [Burkholderia pseudomallei]